MSDTERCARGATCQESGCSMVLHPCKTCKEWLPLGKRNTYCRFVNCPSCRLKNSMRTHAQRRFREDVDDSGDEYEDAGATEMGTDALWQGDGDATMAAPKRRTQKKPNTTTVDKAGERCSQGAACLSSSCLGLHPCSGCGKSAAWRPLVDFGTATQNSGTVNAGQRFRRCIVCRRKQTASKKRARFNPPTAAASSSLASSFAFSSSAPSSLAPSSLAFSSSASSSPASEMASPLAVLADSSVAAQEAATSPELVIAPQPEIHPEAVPVVVADAPLAMPDTLMQDASLAQLSQTNAQPVPTPEPTLAAVPSSSVSVVFPSAAQPDAKPVILQPTAATATLQGSAHSPFYPQPAFYPQLQVPAQPPTPYSYPYPTQPQMSCTMQPQLLFPTQQPSPPQPPNALSAQFQLQLQTQPAAQHLMHPPWMHALGQPFWMPPFAMPPAFQQQQGFVVPTPLSPWPPMQPLMTSPLMFPGLAPHGWAPVPLAQAAAAPLPVSTASSSSS